MNSSRRDFSDTNIQHFIQDLLDINWDFVTNFDSVNDSYSHFLDYVLHLYNKHFPEKEMNIPIHRNKSPWLTEGIYNCIRRKNYLYRKYFDNPTDRTKCC